MIIASAVKLTNGSIYVGNRHCDCFANIRLINTKAGMTDESARKLHFNCEQGFITSDLEFLDRESAYYYAFNRGQCKIQCSPKPCLMSEDLW